MDKRRRAALSAPGHALIAAVGAAIGAVLGAVAMDLALQRGERHAIARDVVPTAPAREPIPAAWPLPVGGFVMRAVDANDADAGDCVIARTGANGEWLWRQHLPAACVIYGVDDSGGTWVASDGIYRLAPDGRAQRMDTSLREAAVFLFRTTPAAWDTRSPTPP